MAKQPVEVNSLECGHCGAPICSWHTWMLDGSGIGPRFCSLRCMEEYSASFPTDGNNLFCDGCGEPIGNTLQCPHCDSKYIRFETIPIEIDGVGKDAPMDVNEHGGKQSKMEYAFTQLDALAMFQLAGILQKGADKYGRDNWKRITPEEHLNHALQHIFAYLAGDEQDDHLGHAFCRLMFAIVVDRDGLSL